MVIVVNGQDDTVAIMHDHKVIAQIAQHPISIMPNLLVWIEGVVAFFFFHWNACAWKCEWSIEKNYKTGVEAKRYRRYLFDGIDFKRPPKHYIYINVTIFDPLPIKLNKKRFMKNFVILNLNGRFPLLNRTVTLNGFHLCRCFFRNWHLFVPELTILTLLVPELTDIVSYGLTLSCQWPHCQALANHSHDPWEVLLSTTHTIPKFRN